VYSELFYRMAARLGIEVYICLGYAGDGYHAWNMVVLDGEPYFYDVCWFDGGQYKYLHSTTAWGREYVLKDL
jgi:transglutaminase/protease-like cytokinesis protein 3